MENCGGLCLLHCVLMNYAVISGCYAPVIDILKKSYLKVDNQIVSTLNKNNKQWSGYCADGLIVV